MSQYKAEHMKRKRAAEAALPAWVAAQPSLEAIRQHPPVPASLLPRLEGLWAQRGAGGQQQQQPGPEQPGAQQNEQPGAAQQQQQPQQQQPEGH
jgi:hypothetical protein